MPRPTSVAEYINAAPKAAQKNLRTIRAVLKKAAPKATETLKWGTPVFEEKRILFAYAAFKSHINFVPTPATLKRFKKQLTAYVTGKGSVQFPHDKPIPKTLVGKIAAQRVKELKEHDARWM